MTKQEQFYIEHIVVAGLLQRVSILGARYIITSDGKWNKDRSHRIFHLSGDLLRICKLNDTK
jgi:hypothetical protein